MAEIIDEDLKYLENVVTIFSNNKFEEAMEMVKSRPPSYIYSRFTYSLFVFSKASLTFYEEDFSMASDIIKDNLAILQEKSYRHHFWDSLFKKSYYNHYTCEQIHTEVLISMLILLDTFLLVLKNESLSDLFKCGYNMANVYRHVKILLESFSTKNDFFRELLCDTYDFIELLLTTYKGCFNMFLASLPPKLTSLVNFVGIKGDLNQGKYNFIKVIQSHSILSPMCATLLGLYYTVVFPHYGLLSHINQVKNLNIIREYLKNFLPNVCDFDDIYVVYTILGDFANGIELAETAINQPLDWPHLSHIFLMEMIVAYSLSGNFEKVEEISLKVANETNWTKSFFYYVHGCALLMIEKPTISYLKTHQSDTLDNIALDPRVVDSFDNVIKYIRTVLGKRIPDEKYVFKRCKAILKTKITLFPLYETLYISNYIHTAAKNTCYSNRITSEIESTLEMLPDNDEFCRDKFFGHLILATLVLESDPPQNEHTITSALKLLRNIIQNVELLHQELFIVASAACELARYYIRIKDFKNTEKYVKIAKVNNTKYTLETKTSFRIQAIQHILENLKMEQDNSAELF